MEHWLHEARSTSTEVAFTATPRSIWCLATNTQLFPGARDTSELCRCRLRSRSYMLCGGGAQGVSSGKISPSYSLTTASRELAA